MRAPVCVRCQRSMAVASIGTEVTFMARAKRVPNTIHAEQGPYETVTGDTYRCLGCGTAVVAGFAEPCWQAHEGGDPPAATIEVLER